MPAQDYKKHRALSLEPIHKPFVDNGSSRLTGPKTAQVCSKVCSKRSARTCSGTTPTALRQYTYCSVGGIGYTLLAKKGPH